VIIGGWVAKIRCSATDRGDYRGGSAPPADAKVDERASRHVMKALRDR
jgi:hypothetical protein